MGETRKILRVTEVDVNGMRHHWTYLI